MGIEHETKEGVSDPPVGAGKKKDVTERVLALGKLSFDERSTFALVEELAKDIYARSVTSREQGVVSVDVSDGFVDQEKTSALYDGEARYAFLAAWRFFLYRGEALVHVVDSLRKAAAAMSEEERELMKRNRAPLPHLEAMLEGFGAATEARKT